MDEMEISKDPRLMELLTQVGGMPPEDLLAAEAGTQQPVINQGDEIVELGDDFGRIGVLAGDNRQDAVLQNALAHLCFYVFFAHCLFDFEI